jgi:hypothetical protein
MASTSVMSSLADSRYISPPIIKSPDKNIDQPSSKAASKDDMLPRLILQIPTSKNDNEAIIPQTQKKLSMRTDNLINIVLEQAIMELILERYVLPIDTLLELALAFNDFRKICNILVLNETPLSRKTLLYVYNALCTKKNEKIQGLYLDLAIANVWEEIRGEDTHRFATPTCVREIKARIIKKGAIQILSKQ